MKTIMCFGTFDLLHPGHLSYLQQAKQQGDHLIVVVARDKTKEKEGKKTLFSEQERLGLVKSLAIVDEAILGHEGNLFKIVQEKNPQIICLGYDHKVKKNFLRQKLSQLGITSKIMRMKPYQ
ncbi:adenylyltransferase/cytidyltransferase family protein, partial [Candidatus Woesearchaeota archaeon]|nr:adenylyltransferase/cytidyltransferase family protein [Candidatus Woesearchaeota archaeon]